MNYHKRKRQDIRNFNVGLFFAGCFALGMIIGLIFIYPVEGKNCKKTDKPYWDSYCVSTVVPSPTVILPPERDFFTIDQVVYGPVCMVGPDWIWACFIHIASGERIWVESGYKLINGILVPGYYRLF